MAVMGAVGLAPCQLPLSLAFPWAESFLRLCLPR